MIKPPAIHSETLRLQSLHSLKILDTHPEDRYDRITRLATRVFNVPIALVSLVDQDRQWFKSRQGLDACETSREISFCGHAIAEDKVLVVEDTLLDERFHDNPLVTGAPDIRFYAGYPLKAPGGVKLGTLCIIDTEPRSFSEDDVEILEEMGRLVEEEVHALAQATTDDLTFICNRRGFTTIASHVLAICKRVERPTSLLLFDLDGFKAINDELGHHAGDKALIDFAAALLKTFRDADVVARLGGDEFCVLCTNLEERDTSIALRRLQQLLDDRNAEQGQRGRLKFSVGSIEYDSSRHTSVDDLIREADERMYNEKRRLKNQASQHAG